MRENDLKIQADLTQLEEDASKFLTNYRLYQQQSSLSPTRSKIKIQTSAGQEEPVNNQEPPLTAEQLAAQQQKQIEYEKIVERHEQLIKASNAKITLANESHEIVERYYKKLENDLNKFKMELEADYSGITETLEKRKCAYAIFFLILLLSFVITMIGQFIFRFCQRRFQRIR